HASTMFRRQVALDLGGYDETLPVAQDYDLWLRLCERHQVANLAESLVGYRVHPGQVSQRCLRAQRASADSARNPAVRRRKALGLLPPAFRTPRLGPWGHLRGAAGSVGDDYLYWAEVYLRMGAPARASRMAMAALCFSPLATRAYGILASCLLR